MRIYYNNVLGGCSEHTNLPNSGHSGIRSDVGLTTSFGDSLRLESVSLRRTGPPLVFQHQSGKTLYYTSEFHRRALQEATSHVSPEKVTEQVQHPPVPKHGIGRKEGAIWIVDLIRKWYWLERFAKDRHPNHCTHWAKLICHLCRCFESQILPSRHLANS